jgi:transcriptional regulator with GAF, ATPase, and Fis domain
MPGMFELRIHCEDKNWAVPLASGTRWRIGRNESCEIQVPDQRVSGEHAELTLNGEKIQLRRTTGHRPIEILGKPVESAELTSGSGFSIGHTNFVLINVRDGMNLLDTQTVLARALAEGGASSAQLAAISSGSRPAVTVDIQAVPASGGTLRLSSSSSLETSTRLMAQVLSLLTKAADKQSLAQALLELVCRRLMATRAVLASVKDAENLDVIAVKGIAEEADIKSLISTTVLKQIIDERQAVIIGDTAKLPQGATQHDSIVRNHIRAVACTPVFNTSSRLIGLLYVDNQSRTSEFTAQDAEMLIWLAQVYSLLDDNLEMRRKLEAEVTALKQGASAAQMVAEAPSMIQLLERAKKAAQSTVAVLILGESGTGKECIARLLHQQSPRATKAFVARNCAAIPENLFESEMFGHKKGSFTGAESDRRGAFLEADGGTLFLDEIADLPSALQTKLLRAIQEKVIRPVGSDKDIPVNVRIICATNRDLLECCTNREFREDLYYRLATVTLTVPPLRDRREDIVPLARHFVRAFSDGLRNLTKAAEDRLVVYQWPGNVRELRSIMEQAVIFAAGSEINADEINLPGAGARINLAPQSLAEAERRHILSVLASVNGNKTEAAKALGLARSTLLVKLNSYKTTK